MCGFIFLCFVSLPEKGGSETFLQVIACENQAVCWTTPLGLPVVQPYCKTERYQVSLLYIDIFFSFWFLLKGSENKRTESGSVLHSQVYYYILWIIIKE